MKKILFGAILPLLLLSNCKKKSDPAPEPDKYMTITAASLWNYDLINNPSTTPTTTAFTLTSTTRDTTIGTRVYHIFTNSNGNTSEYYNISGNDYYTYRDLGGIFSNTKVEVIYLKDNLLAGASWVQNFSIPYSGITLPTVLTNTIQEKGITKTVNGVAYTDVVHVVSAITITGLPAGALTTNIHYYYARKFGLIQNDTQMAFNYLGMVSNTESQTKLKSAVLK